MALLTSFLIYATCRVVYLGGSFCSLRPTLRINQLEQTRRDPVDEIQKAGQDGVFK